MAAKIIVYLIAPLLAAVVYWRLGAARPLLSALAASFAFAMICQLALVVMYSRPVEANLRANLLMAVAYYLPFSTVLAFPLVARSGWSGAIGALLGTLAGLATAAILFIFLGLVRTKLYV